MNKTEINAQLDFLEAELDNAGVDYVKVNREQTNPELEKEIARLESLLPDDDAEYSSGSSSTEQTEEQGQQIQSDTALQASATAEKKGTQRQVQINKGVNIEITLAGKKQILHGLKSYSLPDDRARSIVAEKLGTYDDDSV